MVYFLMVLDLKDVNYMLARRAHHRQGLAQVEGRLSSAVGGLTERIKAGETTGHPLCDLALVAHGADYQPVFERGKLLQAYLAEHARASAPSLIAVYEERSAGGDVCYDLHLGVLAGDGMNIDPQNSSFKVYVSLDPNHPLYGESGKAVDSVHFRSSSHRLLRDGCIVLDHLITPALEHHPKDSTIPPRDGQTEAQEAALPRSPSAFFFSRKEAPPHLEVRIYAGTDAVRAYLREFWQEREPLEAKEFFRQITQRITCEPSP